MSYLGVSASKKPLSLLISSRHSGHVWDDVTEVCEDLNEIIKGKISHKYVKQTIDENIDRRIYVYMAVLD